MASKAYSSKKKPVFRRPITRDENISSILKYGNSPPKSVGNSSYDAKKIYSRPVRPKKGGRSLNSFSANATDKLAAILKNSRDKAAANDLSLNTSRQGLRLVSPRARNASQTAHRRIYSASIASQSSRETRLTKSDRSAGSGKKFGPNGLWQYAHRTKKGYIPGNP